MLQEVISSSRWCSKSFQPASESRAYFPDSDANVILNLDAPVASACHLVESLKNTGDSDAGRKNSSSRWCSKSLRIENSKVWITHTANFWSPTTSLSNEWTLMQRSPGEHRLKLLNLISEISFMHFINIKYDHDNKNNFFFTAPLE